MHPAMQLIQNKGYQFLIWLSQKYSHNLKQSHKKNLFRSHKGNVVILTLPSAIQTAIVLLLVNVSKNLFLKGLSNVKAFLLFQEGGNRILIVGSRQDFVSGAIKGE